MADPTKPNDPPSPPEEEADDITSLLEPVSSVGRPPPPPRHPGKAPPPPAARPPSPPRRNTPAKAPAAVTAPRGASPATPPVAPRAAAPLRGAASGTLIGTPAPGGAAPAQSPAAPVAAPVVAVAPVATPAAPGAAPSAPLTPAHSPAAPAVAPSPAPAAPPVAPSAPLTPARSPAPPAAAHSPAPPAAVEAAPQAAWSREFHLEAERLTRHIEQETDARRQGRLHYELARLYELPLADLDAAAKHFRLAIELAPELTPALAGARRLFIARGEVKDALPLFDAEVRITASTARKAQLWFEKGQLYEDVLQQRKEAREAYGRALELMPDDVGLLSALVRIAEIEADAPRLAALQEQLAATVQEDPALRAAVLTARARLTDVRLGDRGASIELYSGALEAAPRSAAALVALKRLLHREGRWRELAQTLAREAEGSTDPHVRSMAWYRAAVIERDRLNDPARAISALERASAEAPDDVLILEQLARAYAEAGRHTDHIAVLERLVQHTPRPSARLALLHRIGQIAEERAGDVEQAQRWYLRALEQDPTYAPSLAALGASYTRRKEWEPLIAMHLLEAEHARESTRRASAHARVAEVYELYRASDELAEQHYGRALALDPHHAGAFKALSRLLLARGKHQALVELYERGLDHTSDVETRIEYLFRIGRLHEDELHAPGHAVATYRRILEIDGRHLGAIHAWQRAAERAHRPRDLAEALELEAERTTDAARVVPLLHRAGEVYERQLGDDDAALERFRAVLVKDPSYAPNLTSLGQLYSRLGRWEDLIQIYERELAITPKGPPQALIFHKLGEIAEERVGDEARAMRFYRQAIEQDAFHKPALHALQRRLAARGDFAELAKLLELELTATTEPAERARTAQAIAEVYEDRLGQTERALAAYEQATLADPGFRPALDGRVRLLAVDGHHKRLVEELERQAKETPDPLLAVGALAAAGEIARDDLHDEGAAIALFEQALERDPAHLPSLLALTSLYERGARAGQWARLAELFAMMSRVVTHPGARVAALRELARLQAVKQSGGDPKHTQVSILHIDPKDALALTALERAALEVVDEALLTQVDARLAAATSDPKLAAAHRTRLGEYQERAGDPAALTSYRAALDRDPDNYRAARGFARLAAGSGDHALLREAARFQQVAVHDAEAAATLLVAAARVSDAAGDAARASEDLVEALEVYPDHAGAAELLREVRLRQGQVDELYSELVHAAGRSRLVARHAALWSMVADLLAVQKQDLPAALAALNRVIGDEPDSAETLIKLGELYAQDGQWAETVDRLSRAIALSPDDPLLSRAELLSAEVLSRRLGDDDRALISVRSVLSRQPESRAALRCLIEIEQRRRDIEAAYASAQQLVAVSGTKEEQAEAYELIAGLELSRERPEAAAKALTEAASIVGLRVAPELTRVAGLLQGPAREQALTQLVESLTHYSAHAPPAEQPDVALYLAALLSDSLHQVERALAVLKQAVSRAPDDARLRHALAQRLAASGHYPDAIDELRRLLTVDVEGAGIWRELSEVLGQAGRAREQRLALAPLVVLGAATDLERATLDASPPRPGSATPGSFDVAAYRGVDAAAGNPRAVELLWLVSESLPKIYPPELERYGLSTRDRLSPRSGDPLRLLADRVARVFGVEQFDLYVHRAHAGGVEIELGDPPALLVPAHVATLAESQQVFMLARVFASIRRGLHVVDKLAPPQLDELLKATTRVVMPGYGGADPELEQLSKRVAKALTRRGRKGLEDLGPLYSGEPVASVEEWVRRLRLSSARAALVVADDLPGVVTLLRRTEGDLAGLRGPALTQGMALIDDLMRFWVSEAAFTLRRHLGMP
ncbi:MAG: tetratricopeptide repeat protein [Polyangiaceae bacterium]|nr:tetratricopeptide repeat protein [Polyangiaceae bacterium]